MAHKGSDGDLRLSYGLKVWTASYLRCFVFFKLTLNSLYSVAFPLSCSRRPRLLKEGCVKCAEMFRWVAVVGVRISLPCAWISGAKVSQQVTEMWQHHRCSHSLVYFKSRELKRLTRKCRIKLISKIVHITWHKRYDYRHKEKNYKM